MKKKILLDLFIVIIMIGVIVGFGSKTYASSITSVFSGDTITRSTIQKMSSTSNISTSTVLGISKDRESGNWYVWNPKTTAINEDGQLNVDENGNVEAQKIWKIAEYSSETSNIRDYSNLYYCLNPERGFGISNGEMAEGAKDNYLDTYNMKDNGQKSTIINLAGGNLGKNYNKVLWILDNSYIPTKDNNYQKSTQYKKLMNDAGIIIESDERLNLTEDDIEVAQQMAIWYFTSLESTNYKNDKLPSLYLNGKQLSSIYLFTTVYGEEITGQYRQNKAEKLYEYFIKNADENYEMVTPTLTLSTNNIDIMEEGDYYIFGPYSISGKNTNLINSITDNANKEYILLDSLKQQVDNNDFTKVIDSDFYLKVSKNDMSSSDEIKISLTYEYSNRDFIFMTNINDYENTQAVVKITEKDIEKEVEFSTPIETIDISVEKKWADNDNQDGLRPESIKVQLYENTVAKGNYVELNSSNNWSYTWTNLLSGRTYTVKELNSKNVAVEDGEKLDSNYTATYDIDENKTLITNTYIPKPVEKTVKKVWEDINNADNIRPTSIEVQLYKTVDNETTSMGEEYKVTLDDTNNWEYTWTNLPAKENGKTIKYTVQEVEVPQGYEVSYSEDTFIITNTHKSNSFKVELLKVGEDGEKPLTGAWFKINDGQAILIEQTGYEIEVGRISEEGYLYFEYKLEEITSPEGYIKLPDAKNIKIRAKVELQDEEYQITETKMLEEIEGITVSQKNNVITIKVKNDVEITGKYNVAIRKVDENGNKLSGAKFEINEKEYDLTSGEVTILEGVDLTSTDDIILNYTIKETKIPEGYHGIKDINVSIRAKVQKDGNKYKIIRTELIDDEEKIISDENISVTLEGDTIVLTVKNEPIEKKFDLALRKFITKINNEEYSREPKVDTSTIATTGTATYKHSKQPIAVQKGDIVTYTIRVYNEGELDGYVDKITDHLPSNLIPIIDGIEGIDTEKYKDEIEFNSNWLWIYLEDGKTVTTTITSKSNNETYSILTGLDEVTDTKLDAYIEGSDKLDYIDVQIKCLVSDNATSGEYLTNIAEITDAQDINGVQGDGADSTIGNAKIDNLSTYKNEEAINSTTNSYIPGQEDDDDFEKIFVKEFDLSLVKFIAKVNDTAYSRAPVVDTTKLGTTQADGKVITNAIYNHTKEPVIVETGDLVTYTIRVYNEGTLDGYANEITDNIPKGLEFLPDSSINISYKWKMIDADGNETDDVSKATMIVTDYLSDADENNIIKAVSEKDGEKVLSYKDVEVQFKVIATAQKSMDNIIINEAQISADSDRDIDSTPSRDEKYDYETGENEDDIDYESIKLQYFDLALRKFITKVNNIQYNNRYPEIVYNEDGSITYKHTKDPVLVATNDVIIYTIRVYNEGEKAGTATEVTDNLPEGLEFIPENDINKLYNWKLIDENGNETDDVSKAVKITTNILAEETIDGIIVENGQKILSYKDIQIAFKVTAESTSNKIYVNTAEISEDSGDDIDSTPNNQVETEDDLDKEYVKVEYFDLALKKWVTSTKVTYNGKTTVTKTGFTEDSEEIAKVDLVASKMKKTTVKFTYSIKVINEGEIPGYAYEVKDYIPNGLKFVQEDNPNWKQVKEDEVVTDQLKDTLLNPGESATVEITLTWENSTTNLALKTNYAEISEDSGDDIDSTPNNFNKQEDDIDDAQVILSIKTAGATTYVSLILISIIVLAGGVYGIKKYVLK